MTKNEQGSNPTKGIAGQNVDRRALMRFAATGFVVLSVGSRTSGSYQTVGARGDGGGPGDGFGCGEYNNGNLTGDSLNCGINGASDASCGMAVTEGSSNGPVGVDLGCGVEFDSDCAQSGGTYAHSDSNCAPSGVDLACGLPGQPNGDPYQDAGT